MVWLVFGIWNLEIYVYRRVRYTYSKVAVGGTGRGYRITIEQLTMTNSIQFLGKDLIRVRGKRGVTEEG